MPRKARSKPRKTQPPPDPAVAEEVRVSLRETSRLETFTDSHTHLVITREPQVVLAARVSDDTRRSLEILVEPVVPTAPASPDKTDTTDSTDVEDAKTED